MKRRSVIAFIVCLMVYTGFGRIAYGAERIVSDEKGPGKSTVTLTETYNQEMGLYEEQFAGGRRFVTQKQKPATLPLAWTPKPPLPD